MQKTVFVDTRWDGPHGIGRFSQEIVKRLSDVEALKLSGHPLSLRGMWSLQAQLFSKKCGVFFTPGFNPPFYSAIPYIFVIHDLIHLQVPEEMSWMKKIYYQYFLKRSALKAFKILTVSEFSKKEILKWLPLDQKKICVVGNGVSIAFHHQVRPHNPGYSYLFCLGNNKPHKNMTRLLQGLAKAKIDPNIRLVVADDATEELTVFIRSLGLDSRVSFDGLLSEDQLASYYRGALAFLFPSLYEGFGLPIVEAMACGTPVLTSDVTSMPEVAGDAALLVDPYDVNAVANGIEFLVNNKLYRDKLINKGLKRVKEFSWDKTAAIVNTVLQEALDKQ